MKITQQNEFSAFHETKLKKNKTTQQTQPPQTFSISFLKFKVNMNSRIQSFPRTILFSY